VVEGISAARAPSSRRRRHPTTPRD
jgi:hypothetical protein